MDKKQEEQSESVDWEAKAAEFEAGWKRAVADLDNYRKDTEKRQVEMMQYLKAQALMEMLSVYDDLAKAMTFLEEGQAKEGLNGVQKKIADYLKAQGLEEIRPQAGDDFDPEKAEAISMEENEVGENKVIETVETGIEFNGKVIKPAKVRVGK